MMAAMPALRLVGAQRANLTPLRGRKPDRRSEAEEAWMEVRAAGQEMKATATRITNALMAGDMHSAMHYASRLWALGHSYTDPGDTDHAA